MKSIIYIRMDDHKNMYSLCGIHSSTEEIIAQIKCATELKNIFKFIRSAKERVYEQNEVEILTGYLGFSLYHVLVEYHDIPCVILSPSAMHGSVKE